MASVIGHDKQKKYLWRALKNHRFASTWLFAGPSGVGKKALALKLAQTLNCQEKKQPCQACSSCHQIQNEQHENLLVISSQKPLLTVDSARQCLYFLRLKSVYGAKVIIIDGIEKMNRAAVNLLLKSLEEPPQNTYFFLLTENRSSVLPTVVSRCQVVPFGALSLEQLELWAKESKQEYGAWLLKASKGRPGLFKELQVKEELRREAFSMWEKMFKVPKDEVINFLKEKEKEDQLLVVSFWLDFGKRLLGPSASCS